MGRPLPEVHDALACLLTYPGSSGSGMRYPAAAELVMRACPETTEDLSEFLEGIAPHDEGELEELYTRTFDNVAERSLEIGWQLFGENYARGVLMVRYRGLMRKCGITEHTELPDHLTHVLPLLARLPRGQATAFAGGQVLQATEKILANLRDYSSPWVGVLEATRKVLLSYQLGAGAEAEVTR